MSNSAPGSNQEFVACYESYFWRYNRIPLTAKEINAEFGTTFTETQYNNVLSLESLIKYFNDRAIPNPKAPRPVLTPIQLDLLRVITDPTDFRTLGQKLKSINVSQAQLSSWMRDATFARLMREETTRQFQDNRTYVLNGLLKEASKGNVAAIKLWAEMTGEYVPGQATTVHVTVETKEIVQKLLEVLQRHVDPDTLELITGEMEKVLFPSLPDRPTVPAWRPPQSDSRELIAANSTPSDEIGL